jgi:hypothetical protein
MGRRGWAYDRIITQRACAFGARVRQAPPGAWNYHTAARAARA